MATTAVIDAGSNPLHVDPNRTLAVTDFRYIKVESAKSEFVGVCAVVLRDAALLRYRPPD
jgi:hypothetical protein